MADADTADMLKAWGLEYYIDLFRGKLYIKISYVVDQKSKNVPMTLNRYL